MGKFSKVCRLRYENLSRIHLSLYFSTLKSESIILIKTAFHDDDEYNDEEIHNADDNDYNVGDGFGSADNPEDKLVMHLNISCLYPPLAKRRNLQFIADGDA